MVAITLAVAGCGSAKPHVWVTAPTHTFTACASPDCGPAAVTVHWDVTIANVTGYLIFVNGTQVADVSTRSYTFVGLDCNTTYTLGVKAHDGVGGTSALVTTPYSASCAAPTNTTAPSISGSAVQGSTLTASTGSWASNPYSFSYQWEDCTGSCTSISGATGSTYVLQASDLSAQIAVVVTGLNAFGSAQATSAQVGPVTGTGLTCNLNATTSTFASQVSAATAGQVVCLTQSVNYGTWNGTNKAITIAAAPGASPALQFNFTSTASNFTIDGSGAGGSMTSAGGSIASASNLTIRHVSFTDATEITSGIHMNIVFDGDHWDSNGTTFNLGSGCSPPARVHLSYSGDSGVTIQNSTMIDPAGGLPNAADGIQTGAGLTIKNNVFQNIRDNGGACHNDAVQGVGATNVIVTGNIFLNDADAFVDFDDSTTDTITDNACRGLQTSYGQACTVLYGDLNSLVEHNTSGDGAAMLLSYKTTGRGASTGTIIRNNVGTVAATDPNDTPASVTHNLYAGAASPNLSGTPTFVGGASPTTWAGFALTAGSAGHNAATDGLDVGIRTNPVLPPSNTAEPAVSGTVATGSVLSTTNGTWTGSPTFTYQWQDCATDGTTCANITGATASTYTVAAGDAGHTIAAQVTATNSGGSTTAAAPTVPLIDEFSGTTIDANMWHVMNQQGDTSASEQECYQPGQAAESGGFLTETAAFDATGFTCAPGTPSDPGCTGACATVASGGTAHYKSAALEQISTAFTFGTVTARVKFGGTSGSDASPWGAIWLLGAACQGPTSWLTGTAPSTGAFYCPWSADSSDAAEVDIAEDNTQGSTAVRENVFNSSGSVSHACVSGTISDIHTNYHIYELDWTSGSLIFKIDGVTQTSCTLTSASVPSHPMFLIMQLALQPTPTSADFPFANSVDYIRVSH